MEFWQQYPRKPKSNEKKKAYLLWVKLHSYDRGDIYRILPQQIDEKYDFPYPTTYLRRKRWKDFNEHKSWIITERLDDEQISRS